MFCSWHALISSSSCFKALANARTQPRYRKRLRPSRFGAIFDAIKQVQFQIVLLPGISAYSSAGSSSGARVLVVESAACPT
jgi:hypothetical protein